MISLKNDKLVCNWCCEEKASTLISFCNKCGESSYVCHDCLKSGKKKVSNKQLIINCSICKENQLINLPNNSQIPPLGIQRFSSIVSVFTREERRVSNDSNDLENPPEENVPSLRTELFNSELIKKNIYRAFIWFLIFLVISWMFAPFSYFIIFRMRNSKNYFVKFQII